MSLLRILQYCTRYRAHRELPVCEFIASFIIMMPDGKQLVPNASPSTATPRQHDNPMGLPSFDFEATPLPLSKKSASLSLTNDSEFPPLQSHFSGLDRTEQRIHGRPTAKPRKAAAKPFSLLVSCGQAAGRRGISDWRPIDAESLNDFRRYLPMEVSGRSVRVISDWLMIGRANHDRRTAMIVDEEFTISGVGFRVWDRHDC
jgi:hypothetical protein